ncbi:LysR family transcriptional regulator [Candidatus Paracaedibacter symbiosus]|uniref:LysR family transcriptional regulator n=1 Tax=Candidatus Paracaedibacter symbiosus TaxID=244582 RepID=UPI000509BEB2|nr:LysR family transcriptional regulator [Candidatus Paracaedibacter symbiosus]
MRPLDLSKLRLFYEIARQRNMTRAAEKLNVSQPALSQALADLEYNLKSKLFHRLSRGMSLTVQGERLFVFAENIMQQTESFEKSFHEKGEEIAGEIKIATLPFLGSGWLIPHLAEFLEKYPKINPKIFRRSENIDFTKTDIAILPLIPHQPDLIQHHLFTVQGQLFASPAYLEEFGRPQTLEELDHHQLITYGENYSSPYGSPNWLISLGRTSIDQFRKSYFEINSIHGMWRSAQEGLGIAELPNYSTILDSGLEKVLPDTVGLETSIYYIFPKGREKSKKINLLLEYLSTKGK